MWAQLYSGVRYGIFLCQNAPYDSKKKTNASHVTGVDVNFSVDVEFFNGVELSDQGVVCG